ncbi:hypothetical protein D5H75_31485 [Bailinhaonella thermotolerans]|uniref:nucleoside-diphosphate kinase n=1 Tax=Bailinhaonella thermotolerans TaxID=1070861 RepID=A0A3A4AB30_9ACTN|nr:hypothetical protein D5H75_31485 [Bailinhaonella thermotolerans]
MARLQQIDWHRWSIILLKPDCLQRGLVEPVLARCAEHVQIIAQETVVVTQAQIFAHYDDLLRAPERLAPIDVPADLRRCYVGKHVVIALGHGPLARPGEPDTPARLRALLGHYDPARARPTSIRGHFGIDNLAKARSEGRLIDNVIHTSDDAAAACRDFLIWFGIDRTDLLIAPRNGVCP